MSQSIDTRIVEMQFDNEDFEKRVRTTQQTIDQFDRRLDRMGQNGAQGLSILRNAFSNFSLSHVSNAVDNIAYGFTTMGIVGKRVLENLTDMAIGTAKKVVSAIASGGWTRALNIEQAKFQLEGLGVAWEDIAEDINYGVKDTAYGLDAAAKVASQLVASQVALGDDMKASLRGISGVAAMTSASYEDIGRIFTTVAGQGRLMGDQLNQLAGRGLNAAATLAHYLNTTEENVRKMTSKGEIDFHTFAAAMDDAFGDHAKEANKTFTGSLSNMKAALSRVGAEFASPQLDNLRDIFNAITPLIDRFKKSMGPAAKIINNLLSTLTNRLTKFLGSDAMFNLMDVLAQGLHGIAQLLPTIRAAWLNVFPESPIKILESAIKKWKIWTNNLHVTTEQNMQIRNTLKGVFSIIGLISEVASGFIRAAGPYLSKISNWLLGITSNFGLFLKHILDAVRENDTFYNVFKNTFSFIEKSIKDKIIPTVVAAYTKIKDFISLVKEKVVNPSWEWISRQFENFKESGNKVKSIFESVSEALKNIFKNKETEEGAKKTSSFFEQIATFAEHLKNTLTSLIQSLKDLVASLNFGDITKGLGNMAIGGAGIGIFAMFFKFINDIKSEGVASIPSNIAKIVESVKEFIDKKLPKLSDNINDILSSVKDSINEFTTGIKLENLKKVATAIAILSASLFVLSAIDPIKLGTALAAVSAMLMELVLALRDMTGTMKWVDATNLEKAATAIIIMASAVAVLSVSLALLSVLKPSKMGASFAVISGLLLELTLVAKYMSTNTQTFAAAAGSLMILAGVVEILSLCIALLSILKPERAWQSSGIIAALVLELALVGKYMSSETGNFAAAAASLLLMAVAIDVMVAGIAILSLLPVEQLWSSILAVSALIVALTIFAHAMSSLDVKDLVASTMALKAMAGSLTVIATAIALIADIESDDLLKSVVTLVGTLALLIIFMKYAEGNLETGGAILMAAAAIIALALAFKIMATLNPEELIASFIAIVGVLAVLAVASIALSECIPALLAVAGAFALIGAGAALFGLAMLEIATAITLVVTAFVTLSAIGATGALAIVAAIAILVTALELLVVKLAAAIVSGIAEFFAKIKEKLPAIMENIINIVSTMIEKLRVIIPQVVDFVLETIVTILTSLQANLPQILELVFTILDQILTKLIEWAPTILEKIIDLINVLVIKLGEKLPDILNTIIDFVIMALTALADLITTRGDEFLEAVNGLILAAIGFIIDTIISSWSTILQAVSMIIEGLIGFFEDELPNFIFLVEDLILAVLKLIGDSITRFVVLAGKLVISFLQGMNKVLPQIITTVLNTILQLVAKILSIMYKFVDIGARMILAFMQGISSKVLWFINEGVKIIIQFINGLADAIERNKPIFINAIQRLINAAISLIKDTIRGSISSISSEGTGLMNNGFIRGISNAMATIRNKASEIIGNILGPIRERIGEFGDIGRNIITGLAGGIGDSAYMVINAISGVSHSIIAAAKRIFKQHSPSKVFDEIGKFNMKGLAGGTDKYGQLAVNATENVAEDMITTMSDALKKSTEGMGNTDMTIRPSLDLSDIDSGLNLMSKKFAATDTLSVSASLSKVRGVAASFNKSRESADDSSESKVTNNYNMTQNNYSPKALSRTEIYRHTKNQFSKLKDVTNK